ncbi:MAG TPA: replicative DNA helicase, partial [Betaproteobacteria bacterium]|nr:replicative DNA helicase [Betaproteobacteria bacterium]
MAKFQNTADPELAALKLPPHSVEAEQSVLGGLLLENHAWDRIADVINQNDFYRHDHKQIYRAITRLIEQGKPADVVTVGETLDSHGELANVGGLSYLVALAQNTPSAANIRRYAEIVRERGVMRKLVEVGTEIADSAYNPAGRSASELLDQAEGKVFDIAEA